MANKKNKQHIFIKEWLYLKPYDTQTLTDSYYLQLCNKVEMAITQGMDTLFLQAHLDQEKIQLLSIFLTSYLEDLVSETKVWNTFIRLHKEMYGKPLPYYSTEDYYEGEINAQDVCFLIWYYINCIQDKHFYAPLNDFILTAASEVMQVFEKAWEYAPENKVLQKYYTINEDESDYYKVRVLTDTLLFKTYLFFPDTALSWFSQELDILQEHGSDEQVFNFLNDARDGMLQYSHTRLLALKGHQWAAEILGSQHTLHNDLKTCSQKITGYFFYKGQNDEHVFLEHIASGKKFNLTKKSFDHNHELKDIDTILFIGIVCWQGEWWFSGVYVQMDFNADLVLEERNSIKSRSAVSFLDEDRQDLDKIRIQQYRAFLDYNQGSPIAFKKASEVMPFLEGSMEHYNQSLKLSKKERKEAQQRARKQGLLHKKDSMSFNDDQGSALIFFNPNKGPEVAVGVNSAFPAPNNSFFKADESRSDIIHLFLSPEISADLARYCVENYQKELPFLNDPEGKLYLDDLDFSLRLWKRENYDASSNMAFIGEVN